MKYEREFVSEELPCGDTLRAIRNSGSKVWRIDTGWKWKEVETVVSSIPGTVRFLQKLYDNTPKSYRK